MTDLTPRLALPLLVSGQAQKESFHNEALMLLDLAVQAGVVAIGTNQPPADAAPGDCWIVGTAPTGAWAGHPSALAGRHSSGWRFVPPSEGMTAWDRGRRCCARFTGGVWVAGVLSGDRVAIGGVPVVGPQRPAIAAPGHAGTTVDEEARTAIAAILDALRAHGLIAT